MFETYGNREVMLMATECEEHDGLHVQAENLVVEVVVRRDDTDGTRPAAPGELGEVVVTDLHNLAMPFIRYATGDLATAADDSPCGCGRGLPRIASVEGRTSDVLEDGDGHQVSGIALMTLFVDLAPGGPPVPGGAATRPLADGACRADPEVRRLVPDARSTATASTTCRACR